MPLSRVRPIQTAAGTGTVIYPRISPPGWALVWALM